MCGGTATLSFSHPVVHWAFKVGVAADIAARPPELFNHAPPSDDAAAGDRDWTKKDARFNTSVPLLPLFEEFKSIGALILDHIAGGLCHELFVRVAPSSASVLATGGAMEGDLTGLASVNRCLYKFTHGHGYGGGARGSGATGPQSGHADVDVEHQDTAACVLGAPSPFLTTIFSCDPTAARRVDVLVTSEDRVVRLEDCVAGAVPDGARWATFVLSVGDSVTFHSSALHGGGCNHAPDGAFDQVAGHAYWPGRPIRVVADSSWTVVAGVDAEAMTGMPQRKAGCRTCVALDEQQ